jgi:aryl-alcohol dehydrogenase-like predicted oxidoreductase
MTIKKRRLGKTGKDVTILGLGGEGVLRTFDREKEADALINRAIDLGINYFDSASAYSGSESYYGAALKERREEIFLTSKSRGRFTMLEVEQTLIKYLDLMALLKVS